jgi:hypothetical protein
MNRGVKLGLALCIDAEDLDGATAQDATDALQWFLARDLGLVLVGLREPLPKAGAHAITVDVAKPSADEQRAAWTEAIQSAVPDKAANELAMRLAGQFQLNLTQIRSVAEGAIASSASGPIAGRLWDACCGLARPRLDQLAQRIEPTADWDDLVLGAEASALLSQIAAQVRCRYQVYEDWGYAQKQTRGLGINALFAGESGTGKTMAAEVLANELQLALYRIDLSAVASKYIGETEKNLRKLFDAAERGGAILFFDEADALFGKRSEVKDSHDRYANIEINYLLQRMEAFSGLAILATNMKGALDPAFLRRLRFVVNFAYPGAAERKQIWQKAFAPGVPRGELDFDHLALQPVGRQHPEHRAERGLRGGAPSGRGAPGHDALAAVGRPHRDAQARQAGQRGRAACGVVGGTPRSGCGDQRRRCMKLHLYIDQLALDGLPLTQRQGALVQEAVEQELSGLLAGNASGQWGSGGALASVQAGAIRVTPGADAVALGRQIAAAVHSGLGGKR